MEDKKYLFYWFIIGVCYQLQIVASLSITELLALLLFPFIVKTELGFMRRNGVIILFGWGVLLLVCCAISCIANKCSQFQVVRGMATVAVIVSLIVLFNRMIRKCPNGIRFLFVGIVLSLVINTFVFRRIGDVTMYGDSVEEIMGGALYWIRRVESVVCLPIRGWYLSVPWLLSVAGAVFMAVFSVTASISGRSSAIIFLLAAIALLIGGKTRRRMGMIGKHFWLLSFCLLLMVPLLYASYKALAVSGELGDAAEDKFERQTRGGDNIISLIIGGRMGSFAGLYSCAEKPILGWGPWAIDYNGNNAKFIYKFCSYEDVMEYQDRVMYLSKLGISSASLIATHSTVVQFWVWFGLGGLLCALYWLYVVIRYLKEDVSAVPHWFGWMVLMIPSFLWDFFFSPYSDRILYTLLLVACLYARAVRLGRVQLPVYLVDDMIRKGVLR